MLRADGGEAVEDGPGAAGLRRLLLGSDGFTRYSVDCCQTVAKVRAVRPGRIKVVTREFMLPSLSRTGVFYYVILS